jgi:hypothetical protein
MASAIQRGMSKVTFLLSQQTFTTRFQVLVKNCTLFALNPALACSPDRVRSAVPASVFQDFLRTVEPNEISEIGENAISLHI